MDYLACLGVIGSHWLLENTLFSARGSSPVEDWCKTEEAEEEGEKTELLTNYTIPTYTTMPTYIKGDLRK